MRAIPAKVAAMFLTVLLIGGGMVWYRLDTTEVVGPAVAAVGEAPAETGGLTAEDRVDLFDALWSTVHAKNVQLQQKQIDWERVKEQYREPVRLAKTEAELQSLLRRTLAELKDSHAYLDFPMDERMQPALRTMMDGDKIVIRSVVAGSAAEKAGLKPGMAILRIDGEETRVVWERHRRHLSDSTEYRNRWNGARTILWGLPGTSVTVEAEGSIKVTLKRDEEITADRRYDFRTLKGGSFYLKLATLDVPELIERAEGVLQRAAAEKPPGLILDLRGNGGGSHQNGLRLANYLSPAPTVWGYVNDREAGLVREFVTRPAGQTYQGRLIVLTDPSCFSACDLVATYLQQTGRGVLVGEPTSGATYNASEHSLPFGYTLHLPGDKNLLGPDRAPLEGNPAQPDHLVAPTAADWAAGRDAALEKALELTIP